MSFGSLSYIVHTAPCRRRRRNGITVQSGRDNDRARNTDFEKRPNGFRTVHLPADLYLEDVPIIMTP